MITYVNDQNAVPNFLLLGNKLYTTKKLGKINYRVSLADAKRDIMKELMNTIPNYLLQHPNAQIGDAGAKGWEYFIIDLRIDKNIVYQWKIDENSGPTEVRDYIKKVKYAWSELQ